MQKNFAASHVKLKLLIKWNIRIKNAQYFLEKKQKKNNSNVLDDVERTKNKRKVKTFGFIYLTASHCSIYIYICPAIVEYRKSNKNINIQFIHVTFIL